jgi:hypothetical protein
MRFRIVHHVVRLQIAMDDAGSVGCLNRIADLDDNPCYFLARQWSVALGVPLEDLTSCPLDGEKMQAGSRFAGLDRSYDVRVLYASAELCLSRESGNGRSILAKLLTQDFECHNTILGMVGAVDSGCTALPDHILDAVPGYRGTYERIARHAANLIPQADAGKRVR